MASRKPDEIAVRGGGLDDEAHSRAAAVVSAAVEVIDSPAADSASPPPPQRKSDNAAPRRGHQHDGASRRQIYQSSQVDRVEDVAKRQGVSTDADPDNKFTKR